MNKIISNKNGSTSSVLVGLTLEEIVNGKIELIRSVAVDKQNLVSYIRPHFTNYINDFAHGINNRDVAVGYEEATKCEKEELRKEAKLIEEVAVVVRDRAYSINDEIDKLTKQVAIVSQEEIILENEVNTLDDKIKKGGCQDVNDLLSQRMDQGEKLLNLKYRKIDLLDQQIDLDKQRRYLYNTISALSNQDNVLKIKIIAKIWEEYKEILKEIHKHPQWLETKASMYVRGVTLVALKYINEILMENKKPLIEVGGFDDLLVLFKKYQEGRLCLEQLGNVQEDKFCERVFKLSALHIKPEGITDEEFNNGKMIFFFFLDFYSKKGAMEDLLEFDSNGQDGTFNNIEEFIKDALQELEKYRDEYCYPIIRVWTDTTITCRSKLKKLEPFFWEFALSQISDDDTYSYLHNFNDLIMRDVCRSYIEVQRLINNFIRIKEYPKTFRNIKDLHNELKNLKNLFVKTLSFKYINKFLKNDFKNFSSKSNEFTPKLIKLDQTFKDIISNEMNRSDTCNIINPRNGKRRGGKTGQGKKNKKTPPQKNSKIQNINQKQPLDRKNEEVQGSSEVSLTPAMPAPVLDPKGKNELIPNEVNNLKEGEKIQNPKVAKRVDIKENVKNPPFIIDLRAKDSQVAVDKSIIVECNILMESVRQAHELDRSEKYKSKEDIETQRKELMLGILESEGFRTPSDSIQNRESIQLPIIKLNNGHQSTAVKILNTRNDKESSFNDVVYLVKRLGGYVEGNSKSFTIFWGKKGSGETIRGRSFETIHGKDGVHLIRAGWNGNLVKSLQIGNENGFFSKKTFAFVENYETIFKF